MLAYEAGNPKTPVNAIPPRAWARCQLRFVVGIDSARGPAGAAPPPRPPRFPDGADRASRATRSSTRPGSTRRIPGCSGPSPRSQATNGKKPAILPNLGGSLPNDIFTEILGLPTVWVPHSYPGCSQHAPNEHLPVAIAREGLAVMAGLYWDLGEPDVPARSMTMHPDRINQTT